jgi:amidase
MAAQPRGNHADTTDLHWLDATAQADLVRRAELSPGELVEAAIARIEKLNPELNAVIAPGFDRARASLAALPDGPFRGVPFLLKDLTAERAGDPYHCGARFLRDAGWTSDHDTYLTEKFEASGLVVLGKSNTPEFGSLPTTEPEAYGATHNPWARGRSAGGSSGGSAAAVAAGMVPIAHANDGGGSIRIPASACGIVGLKPSRGRVSFGPDAGEAWGGAAIDGVVSRTVRDSALALDRITGPMPGDPYTAPPPLRPFGSEVGVDPGRLRVGFVTGIDGVEVHPECVAAAEGAAHLLSSLGQDVEAAGPAALDERREFLYHFGRVVAAHGQMTRAAWEERLGRRLTERDVEPGTWYAWRRAAELSSAEYLWSLSWLQDYQRRMARWWRPPAAAAAASGVGGSRTGRDGVSGGFDVLLTPTLTLPPPPFGWFHDPAEGNRRVRQYIAFTAPFNITGQPAVSLPLHWTAEGLPVGVQFVGPAWGEDVLVRLASQIEAARPWADRHPPLVA